MPASAGEDPDQLAKAYEQRTTQVHEARGALADAVSALRLELEQQREQAAKLHDENAALREDNHALREDTHNVHQHAERLTSELHQQRERAEGLEAELSSTRKLLDDLRGMKVVRWTAGPRRLVYRLRRHRR